VFKIAKAKVCLTPLDVIEMVRLSRADAEYWHTHGGCWDLFEVFRRIFPQAEPWRSWTDLGRSDSGPIIILTGHLTRKGRRNRGVRTSWGFSIAVISDRIRPINW